MPSIQARYVLWQTIPFLSVYSFVWCLNVGYLCCVKYQRVRRPTYRAKFLTVADRDDKSLTISHQPKSSSRIRKCSNGTERRASRDFSATVDLVLYVVTTFRAASRLWKTGCHHALVCLSVLSLGSFCCRSQPTSTTIYTLTLVALFHLCYDAPRVNHCFALLLLQTRIARGLKKPSRV